MEDPVQPERVETVDRPASLEYAKPAAVTRRQFRLLLFLTLMNTVLLIGGFLCAPLIQRGTSQFWQDFQHKREQARLQKQFLAEYQKCLNYTPATTQPVYEEDPGRAAKLYGSGGYLEVFNGGGYVPARPWHVPVVIKSPALGPLHSPLLNLPNVIFAHGVKTPAGQERLVCVAISSSQQMTRNIPRDPEGHPHHATVRNLRTLQIAVFDAGNRDVRATGPHVQLRIYDHADHSSQVIWTKDGSWDTAQVELHLSGILRLFPGHVDPSNASHFWIEYELDNTSGRIDAYLQDDQTVVIRPSAGRILDQDPTGTQVTWDPYAKSE